MLLAAPINVTPVEPPFIQPLLDRGIWVALLLLGICLGFLAIRYFTRDHMRDLPFGKVDIVCGVIAAFSALWIILWAI